MGYGFKRAITCGLATGAAQASFPLFIQFDSSNSGTSLKTAANGGNIQNTVTQTGGIPVLMPADLIFTSDSAGSSLIPWEVDYYSASSGILNVWVKITSLSNTVNNTIYVWYGDATVVTQQNTSTFAPTNVWDSNFKGIWHLSDGSVLSGVDSISVNNLTLNNTPTPNSGKLGGAGTFVSASSQSMTNATATGLRITGAVTLSGWFKYSSYANSLSIAGLGYDGTNVGYKIGIGIGGTGPSDNRFIGLTYSPSAGNVVGSYAAGKTFSAADNGIWFYGVATWDGSQWHSYINGAEDSTAIGTPHAPNSSATGFAIGNDYNETQYFNGSIDEVRVSAFTRSANWISTEYANQNAPLIFNTIGSETNLGSSGSIFTNSSLSGIGSGGKFFQNPLE